MTDRSKEPPAPPAGGGETILVVEDEGAVRKAVAFILGKLGYRVLTASSAGEALDVVRQTRGPVHLLLTDVWMPGTSGPDLALTMGTDRPGMKILYVSGHAERSVLTEEAVARGAAFLRKPFSTEELTAKVRAVLHGGSPGGGQGVAPPPRLFGHGLTPGEGSCNTLGAGGSNGKPLDQQGKGKSGMKIFIDTANVEEIREANALGIVDGVTTNPSLIAKEGRDFRQVVREICSIVDGPISAEAVSPDAEGMLAEAEELSRIHENIVVKIPMTAEGLKAVKVLSGKGIKTNVTLVFSSAQALLAAKAGATYVSPFVGRLDDVSQTGMDLVEEIVTIFDNYGFDTEIIVASVRNPLHVVEAALLGAHIATVPFQVIRQLVRHPLTDKGIEKFLADWKKVPSRG